jgi:hypothetical protein
VRSSLTLPQASNSRNIQMILYYWESKQAIALGNIALADSRNA